MIEATSFVEGAVSMDMDSTGNNFKPIKMLFDTGALIPSGIAISEQFFVHNMKGDIRSLFTVEFGLSKRG